MPTVVTKGRKQANASVEPVNNQSLAEPLPDHLRNLVLNYLCHNSYLKTAEAFAKHSAVRHLDEDGDEIHDDRATTQAGDGSPMSTIGSQGSSADLSDEMVRNILLRQHIQFKILSGNIEQAVVLLNQHFPQVLAEENGDETEITDENVNPSRLEYIGETVNPIHLSLNLRILAFIEACRTVPLVYTQSSSRGSRSPIFMDSDVTMDPPSPIKRDPKDEYRHQEELLICVQNLYATVNTLRKPEDRTIYLKELSAVGGLLAYTVPENSPMAKYLHQERRDRVAEQINSAILYHTNMPSVSCLELAVRYTHCLWASLHELRAKVPTSHRLSGVYLPLGPSTQGNGGSEKESFQEARPFDLQLFLNART